MFKDANSKFDDYSILPKIRQILLHWGYELTEKDFLLNLILGNNLCQLVNLFFAKTNTLPALIFAKKFCFYSV